MYTEVPGIFLNAFSRPARKDTTNQNLLRQNFIAYIFRSKRARERKRKQEKEQEQESKREKEQEQEQEKEQEQEQEKEQEQESKRENGKTPSLLRRIILRLGCITP